MAFDPDLFVNPPKSNLILGGKAFDEEKTNIDLIDKIWPRKGLCLLTAPPSFGKTLSILYLIKRLELNPEAILYCGADENEKGIERKLKSLGCSNWIISRLPDGLSQTDFWRNIEEWECISRGKDVRFLILDTLLDYVDYKITQPDSIKKKLSPLIKFANENNVIVVGLCHSSSGKIAPAGHQSLIGSSQRILILKETADNNRVQIDVSRRGPHHSIDFIHNWIDIKKAKELLEKKR